MSPGAAVVGTTDLRVVEVRKLGAARFTEMTLKPTMKSSPPPAPLFCPVAVFPSPEPISMAAEVAPAVTRELTS